VSLEPIETIHRATGQWVGLVGADLASGGDPLDAVPPLLEYHAAGGLVQVSMHADNPATGGSYTDLDVDIERLLRPGTREHATWLSQLGRYAGALQALEDEGVPVIVRPLHEMNTSSFWWSYRNDTMTPERYRRLWRQIFDYLTDEKGLDNLLWAFTPHAAATDGRDPVAWYPGDDVVDIVGLDVYARQYDEALRERVVDFHRALETKPFVFGEIGPDSSSQERWDLEVLRDGLRDHFPFARYFMTWAGAGFGMEFMDGAGTLLNDDAVANRAEAAALHTG
jgi:mannan endo-1,4-beta-mannosidase